MKKTYISPNVKVFEAHFHHIILAGSPNETLDGKGDYDSGVTIGSRQDTFWDDEEEY